MSGGVFLMQVGQTENIKFLIRRNEKMKMDAFIRGMVLGLAAGAAVDMLCCRGTQGKTSVGRAMHRFGTAVDCAVDDVRGCMR